MNHNFVWFASVPHIERTKLNEGMTTLQKIIGDTTKFKRCELDGWIASELSVTTSAQQFGLHKGYEVSQNIPPL